MKPLISCVMTVYNEAQVAEVAIRSILEQSFEDFELLIVDDGASGETRDVVSSFSDPRIRVIRQSNDGLSSARNRGIRAALGEYICFLDADDMRPAWAFDQLSAIINKSRPDCIFSSGMLVELRNEVLPFYDTSLLLGIQHIAGKAVINDLDPAFGKCLDRLALIEPQSANKCIRADLLKSSNVTFPNGYFFEDLYFHIMILSRIKSVGFTSAPCFTYFRRYGRPQITSTNSMTRFDAITVARMALDGFIESARGYRVGMRLGLLASAMKLLSWCEDHVSHINRYQFHQGVQYLMAGLDERYLFALRDEREIRELPSERWVSGSLAKCRAMTNGA